METSTLETSGLRKQTRITLQQVKQTAVKTAVVIAVLGAVAFAIYSRGEELAFAFLHPAIVREVKMVYQSEHAQAEKNVVNRQRYEFISPVPTDSEVIDLRIKN